MPLYGVAQAGSNATAGLNLSAIGPGDNTGNGAIAFPLSWFSTPSQGETAPISDSNTVTWGANISGGSSNYALGAYNGSNFTVIGK